jgi:flagellar hook-length control protein FliK
MSFDHKELGKVDLMVQKGAGDQLNISIGTNSVEAAKFFNRNQADLLGSLAQSGIQVGDFKLETSQGNNNQSQSQDSSKQQFAQGQKGQHQSEFGQREQDSKKREELWEQFGDKEVA